MLCSEHQRLTDWPLFRQSATRWLHSMRLCCAFAPRIVTLSISISSSPCGSLAVDGITSDNLQRLPQTRIDSMEVYENPLHSLMAGELFQSGLIFDAYDPRGRPDGLPCLCPEGGGFLCLILIHRFVDDIGKIYCHFLFSHARKDGNVESFAHKSHSTSSAF